MDLHCVVGQMDVGISLIQSEKCRRSAYISILIPISLYLFVVGSDEHIGSKVELAAVIEKRFGDVLLDDDRPIFVLSAALGHPSLDVVQFISAFDPISTVAEFSRLKNPKVGLFEVLTLVKVRDHIRKLWVGYSFADDEGFRNNLKDTAIGESAILSQAEEHSLLVAEHPVPRQVIVHDLVESYRLFL